MLAFICGLGAILLAAIVLYLDRARTVITVLLAVAVILLAIPPVYAFVTSH